MKNKKQKPKQLTEDDILKKCGEEIESVLSKYKCKVEVRFQPSSFGNEHVLIYKPAIVYKP